MFADGMMKQSHLVNQTDVLRIVSPPRFRNIWGRVEMIRIVVICAPVYSSDEALHSANRFIKMVRHFHICINIFRIHVGVVDAKTVSSSFTSIID